MPTSVKEIKTFLADAPGQGVRPLIMRSDRDYGDYVAEFTLLPLSNMDRYRCLFPANQ